MDSSLVLTNGDDSVFVAPHVEMCGLGRSGHVDGPGYTEFELLDGNRLRITDTTPVGRYALATGDSLLLLTEQAFPRYYTLLARKQRTCRFRVRSSRGIAVLVQRGADAKADSSRVAAMMSRPGSIPRTQDGLNLDANAEAQLVLVPGSWYLTARIAFPRGWDGMKLSFFTYGPESPERPRRDLELVRHLGPMHVPSRRYEPAPEEVLLRHPPDDVLAASTQLPGNISLSAKPDE